MRTIEQLQAELAEVEAIIAVQEWTDVAKKNHAEALRYALALLQFCEIRKVPADKLMAAIKKTYEAPK